jgi:hypothetical protein
MAKFLGQLLFELLWDLAERQVNAIVRQIDEKYGPWLNSKLGKRTALAVGLLLGLAAWGVWPLLAYLLAHRRIQTAWSRAQAAIVCPPDASADQATKSLSTIACSRLWTAIAVWV